MRQVVSEVTLVIMPQNEYGPINQFKLDERGTIKITPLAALFTLLLVSMGHSAAKGQ
jgi:hypothetical protein